MGKNVSLIGVYPPPYGGVTVKCKLFSTMLAMCGMNVTEIDLYEASRHKANAGSVIWQCVKSFRSEDPIVYCIDSKRLQVMLKLQRLFPSSLGNTTVLAVGGVFPKIVEDNKSFGLLLKKVKGIWVETEGMKELLEEMGFSNVSVFPNPKSEAGACPPVMSDPAKPLKLVFFSQISNEKGVDDIIQMVDLLKERDISYHIDFFGHVVPEIQERFHAFVEQTANVDYCGVFDSTKSSVYEKLNGYDILLLPTHWFAEGVPGILVEAKMAGLAVIASDRSFNAEIIQENQDEGFIIREDYPREMAELVNRCAEDRTLVNRMKEGSFQSRKRYAMEEYETMVDAI